MSKKRSGSRETEELRGIIRRYEKQIRELKKQAKKPRVDSEPDLPLESPEEPQIEVPLTETVKRECPHCRRKGLGIIEFSKRTVEFCNSCGHRRSRPVKSK